MAAVMSAVPSSSMQSTPSRPQNLPRRSTLVRRREDDDDNIPSSPSKRSRVTFDSDVEVRTVGEYEKSPELIQEEVKSAFRNRASGDQSAYERLKAVYDRDADSDTRPTSTTLRNYTIALLANISSLDKSKADLVRKVIKSEWLGRNEEYITLFIRLLASLVQGQPSFLETTLVVLVQNLTATPRSNREIPNESKVTKSTIYTRVHKTLEYLLQKLPPASSILRGLLDSLFPPHSDSRRANVVYTQNLLRILSYAPELRADILALINDRLIKIDVQVQIDIEELEDEIDSDHLVLGFPGAKPGILEDLDDGSDSSDDGSDSEEEEIDQDAMRAKEVREMVEKMDAMLDVLFSYYHHNFASSKSSSPASDIIDILLSQFFTTILPTHRSRHTQFLLFHFVQQSPPYIDNFVVACVLRVLDKKQPPLIRQNAAAYLASFVARGMHVPANIVQDVFDYISSELARMRKDYEPTCRGPDLRRYASYYCLVQALLYIFCFRWRDLEVRENEDEDDDDLEMSYTHGHQWKVGVKEAFSANIFSKLNPLKVCSPAIVNEFARVAKHLGVIYVYHLLETNKRIRSFPNPLTSSGNQHYGQMDRDSALSISNDEGHHHLDAYFPFDPYHLPRSKGWLDGDYREWSELPGLDGEREDSDSEEEEDITSEGFEEDTASDRTP